MDSEIFRVFYGLIVNCISAVCKCIEERPEKDGVLVVGKRRLFSRKRRVSGANTGKIPLTYRFYFLAFQLGKHRKQELERNK